MGILKDKLLPLKGLFSKKNPEADKGTDHNATNSKNQTNKPGRVPVTYGQSKATEQRITTKRGNKGGNNQASNHTGNESSHTTDSPGKRPHPAGTNSPTADITKSLAPQKPISPIQHGAPTVTESLGSIPKSPSKLVLNDTPQYEFQHDLQRVNQLSDLSIETGLKTQICSDGHCNTHDVTLGFDFGTSAVKVVVGDATIEKYFAVPFRVGSGIDQYLLPCRLWESSDTRGSKFSLHEGESAYRDLKLSLLADPAEKSHQIRSIAFFALVFQRVRAWLFTEHGEIYRAADIVWNLAIGLPSESHVDNELTPVFKRLVSLAWHLSTESEIRPSAIESLLPADYQPPQEASVSVIPEIAAQIFGFVSSPSSSFDRNRVNRYTIVDIGAGTVDSSVFEVTNTEGLWNFTYYTAVVEPNGAANLHAHRIDWWVKELKPFDTAQEAIRDLLDDKYSTDTETPIPASYVDYVSNVEIMDSTDDSANPDAAFFRYRLLRQIRGNTVLRCWSKNLLEQAQIEGMPVFVCGGGARMDFYAKLIEALPQTPGATWLTLDPWSLTRPSDLICRNVRDTDYDRLSVAYGLSRLHLGEIDTALPLPQVTNQTAVTWRDRYVSQDQI